MIITCCGLIGSGKSTLTKKLAQNNNFILFEEPVDNNPFLSAYYDDPKRWSYTLQTYYLWERYKQAQEAFMQSLRGKDVIIDSSIYSDMAFALVQKWSNYFTDEEYSTYLNMHKIIAAQTAYPDMLIWLNLNIDDTINRINKRARDCESSIPKDYLEQLNKAYKIVLDKISKHTTIVSIDAKPNADIVYQNICNVISKYKQSLNDDKLNYL